MDLYNLYYTFIAEREGIKKAGAGASNGQGQTSESDTSNFNSQTFGDKIIDSIGSNISSNKGSDDGKSSSSSASNHNSSTAPVDRDLIDHVVDSWIPFIEFISSLKVALLSASGAEIAQIQVYKYC